MIENVKVEIKKLTDWERVVDAARFTQRKEGLGKEPSQEFKKQMIISEHSPIRLLEFDIKVYGIPYCNMGHFVRHVHAQPFVSTSRPDITGSKVSRHDMPQDAPVNMQLSLNAQEIINISRLRLCRKADKVTRSIWYKVVNELSKIEPELAKACQPQCVFKGYCSEWKCCGLIQTELYIERRKDLLSYFNVSVP